MMWHALVAVMFAAGTFCVLFAVRNFIKGSASKSWPQTPGTIQRSFVLVEKDSDGGNSYTPKVEYDYTVEGTVYQGSRLRHGPTGSSSRAYADRAVALFAPGTKVLVFFNPQRPADAVLVQGAGWLNLLFAVVGVGLLVYGFIFMVKHPS